jgi:hypothetical protein
VLETVLQQVKMFWTVQKGARQCGWLRHYAINRKIMGSVPDVIGFFSLPNPSSHTMAPGSTRPVTEMSTRNLPMMYRMAGA